MFESIWSKSKISLSFTLSFCSLIINTTTGTVRSRSYILYLYIYAHISVSVLCSHTSVWGLRWLTWTVSVWWRVSTVCWAGEDGWQHTEVGLHTGAWWLLFRWRHKSRLRGEGCQGFGGQECRGQPTWLLHGGVYHRRCTLKHECCWHSVIDCWNGKGTFSKRAMAKSEHRILFFHKCRCSNGIFHSFHIIKITISFSPFEIHGWRKHILT